MFFVSSRKSGKTGGLFDLAQRHLFPIQVIFSQPKEALEAKKMEVVMITPNLVVADLLQIYPQTISVFNKYKMGCVGCVMAPFETLTEATEIYKIPLNRFIFDLVSVITENPVESQVQ